MALPRSKRILFKDPKPTVVDDKDSATRVVKTSLEVGLGDNAERHLSKPIFVIKLGESQPLPNTIHLIDKKQLSPTKSKFQKIDILVVGSLQRYFFWNFTAALTDQQIVELMADIPLQLDLETLALWLPERLNSYARLIEEEYIKNKMQEFDHETFKATFISCDEIKAMPFDSLSATSSASSFQDILNFVALEYTKEGSLARAAYDNSAAAIVNSQRNQILQQISRMSHARSDLLGKVTDENWLKVAHVCSVRYLLEECTLLSAGLAAKGYTSILSPVVSTDAFKLTRSLFLTPEKSISWIFLDHKRLDHNAVVHVKRLQNGHKRSSANSSKVINNLLNINPRDIRSQPANSSADESMEPMTPIVEEERSGSSMKTEADLYNSDTEFENELNANNTQTTEEADSSQEEYKDDQLNRKPRRPF